MSKVKVYQFKRYDINTDQYVVSRRMATREAIERLGAVVISGTAAEVDGAHLDGDGMTEIGFVPS